MSIEHLEGWTSEPFRLEAVLEFVKTTPYPVVLKEVVQGTGLPIWRCHTSLSRLVKKGLLTRQKVKRAYHGKVNGRREVVPGGAIRTVYQYRYVGGAE